MKKLTKKPWLAGLLGFAVGVSVLVAVRVLTTHDTHVHYHANFGLYVNGQRDEFKNFTFYEEVASCGGNDVNNPKIRVHMHNNVNYVVHVHDSGVTWGAFFANLGYTLGDSVLKTDNGIFVNGQDDKKLSFLLNGQPVDTAANRVIGDDDVLLVSYGSEDTTGLKKQYGTITNDAKKYDETADPAACSGSKPLTFAEKLKQSIWNTSKTPPIPGVHAAAEDHHQ